MSRSDLRTLGVAVALLVVVLAAASFARHGLVEPVELTHRCDADHWDGAACTVRTLVVQAFAAQRLGWTALACGLLATVLRWRVLAWVALGLGSAGLVLYSAALGAPAALLGALVLARGGRR